MVFQFTFLTNFIYANLKIDKIAIYQKTLIRVKMIQLEVNRLY